MKFLTAILVTALLGFAFPLFSFMPWWTFVIGSFAVALLIQQKPGMAFLSGFLGMFLLWTVHALIIDLSNAQILSTRIASVLPLGGSSVVLILVTGLVGGLISGFAALTGSLMSSLVFKRRVLKLEYAEPLEDSVV